MKEVYWTRAHRHTAARTARRPILRLQVPRSRRRATQSVKQHTLRDAQEPRESDAFALIAPDS
jgi:hypothetical protein